MAEKVMPNEQFLPVLVELAADGNEVSLPVVGSSMTPFLVPGRDRVCFKKPVFPLKRGEIALFQRRNGDFVLHRVAKVTKSAYWFLGDAQTEPEGPIFEEQICGVVTKAFWKDRWLEKTAPIWRFYSGFWLFVRPLRPYLRKIGSLFFRKAPLSGSLTKDT